MGVFSNSHLVCLYQFFIIFIDNVCISYEYYFYTAIIHFIQFWHKLLYFRGGNFCQILKIINHHYKFAKQAVPKLKICVQIK